MCLTLGLSVKSLTGCRRMVNILNRLGHCISYTKVEEIETEIAYACSEENRILPYDFNPNIPIHLAFDNYDQYVETTTGKDTLHDTVGIAYQNISESHDLRVSLLEDSINEIRIDGNQNRSSRRMYYSLFDVSGTLFKRE